MCMPNGIRPRRFVHFVRTHTENVRPAIAFREPMAWHSKMVHKQQQRQRAAAGNNGHRALREWLWLWMDVDGSRVQSPEPHNSSKLQSMNKVMVEKWNDGSFLTCDEVSSYIPSPLPIPKSPILVLNEIRFLHAHPLHITHHTTPYHTTPRHGWTYSDSRICHTEKYTSAVE